MLGKYDALQKFPKVTNNVLKNTRGGNIFSQARDVIWGFLDGYNRDRHSYKSRHRS